MASARDGEVPPEVMARKYFRIADTPGLNLHIVDLRAAEPGGFRIENLVERTDQRREGTTLLGDYPDQDFIRCNVAPVYENARTAKAPIIDAVQSRVADQYIVYDRIVLPQRSGNCPAHWAIGIVVPRLILPLPPTLPALTPRECDVLDLLLLGLAPREIASRLALSQRTVEHRIQDLRSKFGAETTTRLACLAIGTRLLGKNTS